MEGETLANKSAIDRQKTEFYPTPAEATMALLNYLKIPKGSLIWEPACGEGHMVEVMRESGYNVIATELYDRGYGLTGIDYLKYPLLNCD